MLSPKMTSITMAGAKCSSTPTFADIVISIVALRLACP
jgi:hypothetical protein